MPADPDAALHSLERCWKHGLYPSTLGPHMFADHLIPESRLCGLIKFHGAPCSCDLPGHHLPRTLQLAGIPDFFKLHAGLNAVCRLQHLRQSYIAPCFRAQVKLSGPSLASCCGQPFLAMAVPDFECFADLWVVWEGIDSIRDQVRATQDVFVLPPGAKWVEPTRANAVAHMDLLVPALERLSLMCGSKLPYLGVLETQLIKLYQKILPTGVDGKVLFRNIHELKRLLGFVKRKACKLELTKDWPCS